MSPQQQRFWNELKSLRGQIEYLYLYERHYDRIDRGLKMFLAFTSSGSIAAWVIWHSLSFVWGGLIAASQFLNAIKPHLPFEVRLTAIRRLTGKLEAAFVHWETSWSQVASGELSDAGINSRLAELKKVNVELIDDCLGDGNLPERPRLHDRAGARAARYFDIIYAQGDENDEETKRSIHT